MLFKSGSKVPNPEKINESFQVKDNYIVFNIDQRKVSKLLHSFINTIEEPGFFILEVPLNEIEEKKYRLKDPDCFHKSVYYLNGQTNLELKTILNNYKDILLEDGLISYGFASHQSKEEIYLTKYNVGYIFSKNLDKYIKLMELLQINKVDELITAWDLFNKKEYGESKKIIKEDKDIYKIIDELTKYGLYRYEIKED